MELNLFRSFVAVAEERSFSRAARVLHTSQPTLSRHINRLESELGVRLFERYGRHVECTTNGQLLLPMAQAIVNRADMAVSLLREQAGGGASSVRFGAYGSIFARLLTQPLASFAAAYPRVTINLLERDDAPLEEAVIRGELDAAVITPWGSARTASYHLMTEDILLVVPEGHRLARETAVRLSALARESVLVPPSTVNAGNIVIDAFRRAGIEPVFSYRATYPELTQALVRNGLGVAAMPRILLDPQTLDGLVAIPFAEPLTRDLAIIYPRDRLLSAAARALIMHVRIGAAERCKSGLARE
jgi:DNA-binding transcriptional LysR family regulator